MKHRHKLKLAPATRLSSLQPRLLLIVAFSLFSTFMLLDWKYASRSTGTIHNLSFNDLVSLNLSQDNQVLINYIKRNLIESPEQTNRSYNLTMPKLKDPSESQISNLIQQIFPKKKDGTFVEAGAFDGEAHSTTLYLERYQKWRGLLVEGSPTLQRIIKARNRKVPLLKSCLSPNPVPQLVRYVEDGKMTSHLSGYLKSMDNMIQYNCGLTIDKYSSQFMTKLLESLKCKEKKSKVGLVSCVPLFSALLAAGLTKLDFLSLDTEGSELDILRTLPLNRTDIKLIRVEVQVLNSEERAETRRLLEKSGYERITTLGNFDASQNQNEYFYLQKSMFKSMKR